ncbi:NAD(P)H-dependent oxidoreductase [Volucribacter amazonae]|uniref:NAD(P)H oxidoreductase n=1 Tax=Volucribacter amazonae TaxID=256731 RepID=A0A9X4SMM1_9PAST|nr:NAD(P)H-dependent oxidoreductase [Volucribacter amazonae]MDG6896293.1 NAD(P)H oxidoreductase [Volucribacter amazonae]
MNHLIIIAHPNKQSFNHAILQNVLASSKQLQVETQIRDLYQLDFNPILSWQELTASYQNILPAEIQREQQFIHNADLITLIYPLWWMGFPAILKGYLDRVLSHGFAYKTEGEISQGLLQGKKMQQFITLGSNVAQYQAFGWDKSLDDCLVNGLFNYCGINDIDYQLFGDIHLIDQQQRQNILQRVSEKNAQNIMAIQVKD